MKIKWIIFLILFAFLILTSVNANENITVSDINVTFDEQMWEENLTEINVELPDEAKGNFTVKIDDETIYNETITNSTFKVPITIPSKKLTYIINIYPPLDCNEHKISAFYNNINLNINKTLKIMKFAPDVDYFHFPKEILQYDNLMFLVAFPRSANGSVEYYIDDKLINKTKAQATIYWDNNNPFSNLTLGNHTFKVIYHGDNYYKAFNKTFNFTVTNVLISIPQTINISHDDCISVETLPNITGTVKVYIDDNLVYSSKTDKGDLILSLEKYLKVNSKLIKIEYANDKFTRTKTQLINVTYDFDINGGHFTYGEDNAVEITLPDYFNNNLLTITIDNVKYDFTHPEYIMNNIIEVDVSKLVAGNYSMFVSFSGDEKFEAKNKTYNFTVKYDMIMPYEMVFEDSSNIYLNLPSDAEGNLNVYIDGVLFKKIKLIKGKANLPIGFLTPGIHNINLSYDGADYDVANVSSIIEVEPKINADYRFTAGEDKYIIVKVSKNSKGYVIFNVSGIIYRVFVNDGVAKLPLNNLTPGEYEIDVRYYDGEFESTFNFLVITVYKPSIKIVSAEVSFKNTNLEIKVLNKNGKVMTGKKVTVILNNKKYEVKTNKNGVAVLNRDINLKNLKSKLTIEFMGVSVSKNVNVKKISLKTIKTSKKLILKANIKNSGKKRLVTFKVNGKTIKAKSNKKGYVKISVKKPKGSKVKIQATYLKDTVKQTLKI
ncbi:MAG: hypothetical protein E7Z80_07440 [Methanobrevibacter thaueri]|nr:hypothetical protein [Methanobrevibacter thaueri]